MRHWLPAILVLFLIFTFNAARAQDPSEFFTVSPQQTCQANQHITISYTGPIKPQNGFTTEQESGGAYTASSDDFIFEWTWKDAAFMSGSGLGPFVVYWQTEGEKQVVLTITSTKSPENKIVVRKTVKISVPEVTAEWTHASCANPKGSIRLLGANGVEPYAFSVDGVHFQEDPYFEVDPGEYSIAVRDAAGCSNVKSLNIDPAEDVLMSITSDTTICQGADLRLAVTGNATTYTWEPGPGLTDLNAKVQLVKPPQTTTFTVTGMLDCKTDTKSVTVNVVPGITVQPTLDSQIDPNVPFQLHAYSPEAATMPGVKYEWSPPAGLDNPHIHNPVATIDKDQVYTVKVTVSEGCSVTGSTSLSVKGESFLILMPTAFTPNGDGLNDTFRPENGDEIQFQDFRIYNRWGEVIFASTDHAFVWDGRFRGNAVAAGNYFYSIKGMTRNGRVMKKEGEVMLVR